MASNNQTQTSQNLNIWLINLLLRKLPLALALIVIVECTFYNKTFWSKVVGSVGYFQTQGKREINARLANVTKIRHELVRFDPGYNRSSDILPKLSYNVDRDGEKALGDEVGVKKFAIDKQMNRNNGMYLPLDKKIKKLVQEANNIRLRRVRDVCATENLQKNKTLRNIRKLKGYNNVLVDDKHKLLYCYIPKVACTSWKVKLSLMSGKVSAEELTNTHPSPVDSRSSLAKYGIKLLSSYSPDQIKHRLDTYFKFLFVRHPIERLVSAYRSKFEKRTDNKVEYPLFYSKYGKAIRNITRKNPEDKKSDITFEEFIQFALYKSGMNGRTNEHWEQYHKLCHMCLIDYDFIGKFDSGLVNDISYVLHKISSKKTDHWFPNVTIPRSANKYSEKYLNRIPKSLVRKVELGYDLDFELFGFNSILSEEPGDKS